MTPLAHRNVSAGQPRVRGNALVTAGAGGIGAKIAERLKADGFQVFITDIDRAAGEKVSDELYVEFIPCDSASEADMRHAVDISGPVEVLINNVGIRGATGAFWEIPIDDFRQTLEVNTISQVFMSQLVAPAMMQRRSGVIIMIASAAARTGSVGRRLTAFRNGVCWA
jgi:NAD(P)-dependent dehydrogenase (short-subunit alcohol dehydrogenase family)